MKLLQSFFVLAFVAFFSTNALANTAAKECAEKVSKDFASLLNLGLEITSVNFSGAQIKIKKYGYDTNDPNDSDYGAPFGEESAILPFTYATNAKNANTTFSFSYTAEHFTAKWLVFGEANPRISNECCIIEDSVSVRDTKNDMAKEFSTRKLSCANVKSELERRARESNQILELKEIPFDLRLCTNFGKPITTWTTSKETLGEASWDESKNRYVQYMWKDVYIHKGCR